MRLFLNQTISTFSQSTELSDLNKCSAFLWYILCDNKVKHCIQGIQNNFESFLPLSTHDMRDDVKSKFFILNYQETIDEENRYSLHFPCENRFIIIIPDKDWWTDSFSYLLMNVSIIWYTTYDCGKLGGSLFGSVNNSKTSNQHSFQRISLINTMLQYGSTLKSMLSWSYQIGLST